MKKFRYNTQLEITTNIAKKGCAVACKVCPQELLSKTYNRFDPTQIVRNLSFTDFKQILSKVPLTTRIDFSGYAEPYLNPECSKMIKYAHDSGYIVCVYTTLINAKKEDVDLLLEICQHPTRPFSAFSQENPLAIHLPDAGSIMPIKLTDKYFEVLTYLFRKAIDLGLGIGTHIRVMTMDPNGTLHPKVQEILNIQNIPFKFNAISRASNLVEDDVKEHTPTLTNYQGNPVKKTKKIFCKSNSLTSNVLLPNGDVQLCCHDYGLDAKIGNLHKMEYQDLHSSKKMFDILDKMSKPGDDDLICRKCENAVEYEDSPNTETLLPESLQETLNTLCEGLSNRGRFFYSRFGDGDFEIMQGRRELLHSFSEDLRFELYEAFSIKDTSFIKGTMLNESTFNGNGLVQHPQSTWANTENFIKSHFIVYDDFKLYSHVLLTYLAIKEPNIFKEFVDRYIKPRKKMFIGSVPRNKIEKLIGSVDVYIETPPRDSYLEIEKWWPSVLENMDGIDLVLPCTGMSSRVVNKRLYKSNIDIKSIELGSIVDFVCGINTRSWMSKLPNSILDVLLSK